MEMLSWDTMGKTFSKHWVWMLTFIQFFFDFRTALHYAAYFGRLNLTVDLLAHNASTTAKNSYEM